MTDNERDDREFLEPLVRGLPQSIEPPHDLWPGIAARMQPAQRPPRWGRAWKVAAALVLMALSSFVTWQLTRDAAPVEPVREVALVTPGDIEHYARAADDMASALASAPAAALAPETRAVLARNRALIDSASADCRRALAADPANAALQDLLGSAQRQRLELLQQAARLPRS